MRQLIKWPARVLLAASERHQKRRLKRRLSIPPAGETAITVVAMVRDEALRLPYFLSYYENLGIERFIILDHGSTDDTARIVDAHPKAFRVPVSGNFIYKTAWLTAVLEACCSGRWCLVLDADEFLVYPHMREVPLGRLVQHLSEQGFDALPCRLLDMFPEGDVWSAGYRPGQDPLEVAPYFDRTLSTRAAVFGVTPDLRKVPLVHFGPGIVIRKGQHNVAGARLAELRGCLLHFKFLQDFKAKNRTNPLLRLVDRAYGQELQAYQERMDQNDALVLRSAESERYVSPDELVRLGLMSSSDSYDDFARNTPAAPARGVSPGHQSV